MNSTAFMPRVNTDNPDPRVACVLLLDTSGSMAGDPINELNHGLQEFATNILEDPMARKRTEVMVISFGGVVKNVTGFVEAQDFKPPVLTAGGPTPLGDALLVALDALEGQKSAYREAGIEYFRPWLIIMTDGGPTDPPDVVSDAVKRLRAAQENKRLTVFPIGVGNRTDMEFLGQLSIERPAAPMTDVTSFSKFFQWLSASMSRISVSSSHGSDDSNVARKAEEIGQVALPDPSTWMKA